MRAGTLVAQRLDLERKALTGDPVTLADPVAVDANSAASAVSVSAAGRVSRCEKLGGAFARISAADVPIAATPVRASRIPCPIITPTMRAATSPSCAPMRNCYGLIYSVAIRKISARQQRVDHHYQVGVCAIGAAKKATPKKRDVHRAKVIG